MRAQAGVNPAEGVGVHEAPRGTLIHHYQVDADGLITGVNLIVSTGHNNLAMNRTVDADRPSTSSTARGLTEGVLNRVEAGIRCYDPCLSCSTHAVGQMPMVVELRDSEGNLLDVKSRD